MTLSIDEILAQVENKDYVRVATARVLLRQDMAAQLKALENELQYALMNDAQQNRDPVAPIIAQRLQDLEQEIEKVKVEFKFRSIGHRAWADLLKEHPPRPKDKAINPRIDHNTETFPIAAMAASSIEPKMAFADVQRLDESLNDTQFNQLWTACLDANMAVESPKSAAAGLILRAKEKLGESVRSMEFPGLSSSDDEGSIEQS